MTPGGGCRVGVGARASAQTPSRPLPPLAPAAAAAGGAASTSGRTLLLQADSLRPSGRQLWATLTRGSRRRRSALAAGWQSAGGAARTYVSAAAEPLSVSEAGLLIAQQPSSLAALPPTRSPSPPPVAAQAAEAAVAAAANALVCVEGTVQKVTFRHDDTAYTVMQVQLVHPPVTAGGAAAASSSSDGGAPPSDGSSGSSGSAGEGSSRGAAGSKGGRRVITVVGNLPQVGGVGCRLGWLSGAHTGVFLAAAPPAAASPASTGGSCMQHRPTPCTPRPSFRAGGCGPGAAPSWNLGGAQAVWQAAESHRWV